ncbi:MAG: CtsR family transcriptional regulator [Clostridiaceae bacterium]|nr:CtsR family transcriptional regulator [Clostridiaceae bacterium]
MPRLSDIIEVFIKNMLDESQNFKLEIQRNELAVHFKCSPSQINYVLTTRFTTNKGYYIESRRGGGGCIVIRRIEMQSSGPIMDIIIKKIGEDITYDRAASIINGLKDTDLIDEREANLMKSSVNDRTLYNCNKERNKIRADILKSMLIVMLL